MSTRNNLLIDFINDLSDQGYLHTIFFAQIGLIALALGVSWWVNRSVKNRVNPDQNSWHWRLGGEGLLRAFFPLNAYLLVMLSGSLLKLWYAHPLKLIALASVLLLAMANIRILVYVIRRVFDGAAWVMRWEKYISGSIWIVYALHVLGILPEVAEVLDDIRFPIGKAHISVLTIGQGLLSVAATLLIAMWIGRELERRLMSSQMMDMNVRVVLSKISSVLLLIIAIVVALPLVGIDLTVLSVFGGAVGVGLGFGLQKIASNYLSGFIILLDRSIKIGDLVQIDNRLGTISSITARYVVLKSADGTEALVPNDTLITSTVVNQSYNDKSIWTSLPIQVAYGTDLDFVLGLLRSVTEGEARILSEPAPGAFVSAFADNGINLVLGFWLADPENGQLSLRSSLNLKIWRLFQEHKIEIPYPRREVTLLNPAAIQPPIDAA
ncbi:mechanosensitive ion channel family protein [Iodobacter sp.]|uniref:mechanosensitive ion channel family protein n=1 Tax=Iodobacter sp. TaxID=1915058 RepID=UPI0025F96FAA|nr:mechanosensitive ion channel domain-containing protein [Iodobacter sp.]